MEEQEPEKAVGGLSAEAGATSAGGMPENPPPRAPPVSTSSSTYPGCTSGPSFGLTSHAKESTANASRIVCVDPACTKQATYGLSGSKKREYCVVHGKNKDGMVFLVNNMCNHPECTKVSRYGLAGSNNQEFCTKHARDGMVDLVTKTCYRRGCGRKRTMGAPGGEVPELCGLHAKDGMVVVSVNRCRHSTCSKYPTHGAKEGAKREFCVSHSKSGMVDLRKTRKCGYQGCNKTPSFGVAGRPEFCGPHSIHGMTSGRGRTFQQARLQSENYKRIVKSRRETEKQMCCHEGCNEQALNGVTGRRLEYCILHVKFRAFDKRGKTCRHPGCKMRPSYATPGVRKPEMCARHAIEGMVYLNDRSTACEHKGCTERPLFAVPGSSKVEFCAAHAKCRMSIFFIEADPAGGASDSRGLAGSETAKSSLGNAPEEAAVDARGEICGHPGCSARTSLAVSGSKHPEACAPHTLDGGVDLRHERRYRTRGCTTRPPHDLAGSAKAEFCALHAEGTHGVAKGGENGGSSSAACGAGVVVREEPTPHPGSLAEEGSISEGGATKQARKATPPTAAYPHGEMALLEPFTGFMETQEELGGITSPQTSAKPVGELW